MNRQTTLEAAKAGGRYTVLITWAALVGMSVPLEMCNTVFLNRASSQRHLHAFYIANLAVLMGGIEMVPPSFMISKPWGKPTKWWSVLGGICTLPTFITIAAGAVLGSQLVLITQLAALLGTFLLFDIYDGKVRLSNYPQLLGFAVVLVGVGKMGVGSDISSDSRLEAAIMLFIVAISGVGYALQAKCNGELARDLGSPVRATMVSAMVFIVASLPFNWWLHNSQGVALQLEPEYWYLWIVAGFQSAFYIGSMAYLPKLLGFTTSYLTTLAAKLGTSAFVDQVGWAGKVVPATLPRMISLLLVIAGAVMFNSAKAPPPPKIADSTGLTPESSPEISSRKSVRKSV